MEPNNAPDAGAGSQSPLPVPQNDAGSQQEELRAAGRIIMAPTIRPTKPDLRLDSSEIQAAAERLGMGKVGGSLIAAHKVIGEALREAGAIKIGRSTMLLGVDAMREAAEELRELSQHEDVQAKPSLRLAVIQTKVQLAKAQTDAGYNFVKTAEVDSTDEAGGNQPFKPFQPRSTVVAANQAVVNISQKSD